MVPELNLIVAVGAMLVAGGLIEREPRYVMAGVALIVLGLVASLCLWLLRRHQGRRAVEPRTGDVGPAPGAPIAA